MESLKFKYDRTGFPMVWIDDIQAYMHWYPVTKIQFENFLCAVSDPHFDADWYDEVLSLNRRIAPDEIQRDNYWHAFLTGIKPGEVQRFVRWCGADYAIPTLQEWLSVYRALKAQPPESAVAVEDAMADSGARMPERVQMLFNRLERESDHAVRAYGYDRTLADQMMLRLGVMEWVECSNQQSRWGGMGETHPRFHGALFTPDHGQPSIPVNPETQRLPHYGFRLIRRR